MRHRLITIGWLGGKTAYLDVPRWYALMHWIVQDGEYVTIDTEFFHVYVSEFEFEHRFYTYEAGPCETN